MRFSSRLGVGWKFYRTAKFIQNRYDARGWPRVFPLFAELFPRFRGNRLRCFQKRGLLVKLQNIPHLEMQPSADFRWDRNLPLAGQCSFHCDKVRNFCKEFKQWIKSTCSVITPSSYP